jgi:hypothetical protein
MLIGQELKTLLEKLGGKKYGSGAKGAVGAVGAAGGEFAAKPIIKQHVLGKSAADYERDEKSLFPGDTPPGPY